MTNRGVSGIRWGMVRELKREVWAKPPLFFGASLVVLVYSSLLILLVVLAVTPRRDAD